MPDRKMAQRVTEPSTAVRQAREAGLRWRAVCPMFRKAPSGPVAGFITFGRVPGPALGQARREKTTQLPRNPGNCSLRGTLLGALLLARRGSVGPKLKCVGSLKCLA